MTATSEFSIIEMVPLELPEGWTQARLDDHAAARMRALATEYGRDVVGDLTRVAEVPVAQRGDAWVQVASRGDADALEVRWVAQTVAKPQALSATIVDAVAREDGAWVAEVPAGTNVIVSVRHGLDTESVRVDAFALGVPVPHRFAAPISPGEVEVFLGGPTDRLVVTLVEDVEEGVSE